MILDKIADPFWLAFHNWLNYGYYYLNYNRKNNLTNSGCDFSNINKLCFKEAIVSISYDSSTMKIEDSF